MAADEHAEQPAGHIALGRKGEDIAAQYLEQQGCTILSRNWRCREGELDIVGTDGEVLIVCEVKTRSGLGYGLPAESVTRDKMARIRRLTDKWLCAFGCGYVPVRFDVIAVLIGSDDRPELRHYLGAF